ncbi:TPMT family class I SAM-dependent methyltransferase [Puniceicoccaceae bacterium K14]|nr:TPMT family class I SAM-dependent methyltransferase [Puniceicoccaceae bacterium K14]
MEPNTTNWEELYAQNDTGWDLGAISLPIKTYADQITNRDISILIPGAGNSHEAEYLFNQGFTNITVLDIAKAPLNNIQQRVPQFPPNQLIHRDFFTFEGQFDLIIEQTFFCAIHPSLRPKYVKQMHSLLKPTGKLTGLLFDFPLDEDGPPFGGDPENYHALFSTHFKVEKLEPCYNSVEKRKSRELFVKFRPATPSAL